MVFFDFGQREIDGTMYLKSAQQICKNQKLQFLKMDTNKTSDSTTQSKAGKPAVTKVHALHVPIKIGGKDIRLNVSFKDAMIRFGLTLFLPMAILLIDKHLMIYAVPIMAYLFISAITHFCIIKYSWHRFIRHDPPAPLPPYGENINYPEESV